MKNSLKPVLLIPFSFATAIFISSNAFAYNLLPHSLNGGVGNWGYSKRYYWVDSSASSRAGIINNAYSTWINTSNILKTPISWRNTTTKSDGTVEFYTYNSADGANGYTTYWRYNNSINPHNENWGWCQVKYNVHYNAGQATFAHEIGHTMGLDENNSNQYSIMCQEAYGRKVSSPQYDDLAGINAKYN